MAPKIRSSTLRDYRNGLGRVADRLGHMPLQSLRPLDIEELYAALLRDGHRYGGALAPKTVRNIHIALRRSLADAVRFGLVPRNVATLVKPPALIRAELETWTADEMRQFLESVESDRLVAAYRLLATTGMRRGEVLGLHWSDGRPQEGPRPGEPIAERRGQRARVGVAEDGAVAPHACRWIPRR